jgi:NADPH-dependent 2,4-dienoyl-CoA reductase/sulfur reductase-like enzyme
LKVRVDGKPVEVPQGATVAAAVLLAGVSAFRQSVTGELRGPVCGMGICFECRVTIDGRAHERSCQMPCREGMTIQTKAPLANLRGSVQSRDPEGVVPHDVVIIGAGPAGLAAARRAQEAGASVAIVDDNPAAGGQIWRGQRIEPPAACKFFSRASVVAAPQPGHLTIETAGSAFDLSYRALILATGARERFLPFPGWTLPHVTGTGGLQALVKSGMPIAGKRVVVAGSGPLLLAVAHYLRTRGAQIALVAEQAEASAVRRFGLSLARHPAKLWQAARLRLGIRYLTGCWPIAAEPGSIKLRRGSRTWTERCDSLACGFGLAPNAELPLLLGCGTQVDEFQQTRIPGIYAAGDVTGIGGVDLACVEGEIAGHAAVGRHDRASALFGPRDRHRRFAAALNQAFALREELKLLVREDTLICRCEDVAWGRLRGYESWREAKLQTRCGMGPCQGRVCGGALEFLKGWGAESARPPVFPARIGTLL